MSKIKIGIFGLGRGKDLANDFVLNGCEVVAGCDKYARLRKGFKEKLFRHVSFPISMLQLKGQLSAPIIHARYAREVLHIFPQESYYIEKYIEDTIHFLHGTLFNNEPVRKLALS